MKNNLKINYIMNKKNIWEVILKVIVAAVTAALTAITTTSCIGHGPL
ncbi:MAG: smalltalk protein [Bacteroidaceae bacterium]|nr:smalltalk protein [Bacteroidaceae bacterium]